MKRTSRSAAGRARWRAGLVGGALGLVTSCTCPPHTATAPVVSPATTCLVLSATVERAGASCTKPFLEGTNGCSGALVFPARPVGGATPTVIDPGASFRYAVEQTDSATFPVTYTVDATLGGQPIAISFIVDAEGT